MLCALSGVEPKEPVVSRFGHIFEKTLIEKQLSQDPTCPITKEPLSPEELIPLKVNKAVQPRPAGGASIPGLLQLLQNEWDAGILENFALKKQLDSVRQELAHALYQHDAACRVIARLIKERDEARQALADLQLNQPRGGSNQMEIEQGFTTELKAQLAQLSQQLSDARPNRQTGGVSLEALSGFKEKASYSVHSSSQPGVLSVDVHPQLSYLTVSGGADHSAVVFDSQKKQKLATLTGHSQPVDHVKFHPTGSVILTGSRDKTVRVWTARDESHFENSGRLTAHSAAISSVNVHPLHDYLISTSMDRSWSFYNIHTDTNVVQVTDQAINSAISAGAIHPDCLLLVTGQSSGVINLWDISNQLVALTIKSPHKTQVEALQCSENGYQMVSCDAHEVRLWDLRSSDAPIKSISFDTTVKCLNLTNSGKFLAVGGTKLLATYQAKNLELVSAFPEIADTVTGVCWNHDSELVVSSLDRTLRFYS